MTKINKKAPKQIIKSRFEDFINSEWHKIFAADASLPIPPKAYRGNVNCFLFVLSGKRHISYPDKKQKKEHIFQKGDILFCRKNSWFIPSMTNSNTFMGVWFHEEYIRFYTISHPVPNGKTPNIIWHHSNTPLKPEGKLVLDAIEIMFKSDYETKILHSSLKTFFQICLNQLEEKNSERKQSLLFAAMADYVRECAHLSPADRTWPIFFTLLRKPFPEFLKLNQVKASIHF